MSAAPAPGALTAVDRLVVSLVAGINMRALYGADHPALASHVERILVPAGTEGVKVNTPIAILLGAAGASKAFTSGLAAPLSFAGLPAVTAAPVLSGAVPARATVREPTFREALRDALFEAMREDLVPVARG